MAATKQLCTLPPDSQSGCCGAAAPSITVPAPIFNSRGLSSIQYRIGTFTSFRQAMLDAIAQPDLMASGSTTLAADISASDLSIQVSDFTDTRPANQNARQGFKASAGVIGLQGHDPTTDLSFRRIRIQELPPPR